MGCRSAVVLALTAVLAVPLAGCGSNACEDGVDNDADGLIDDGDPGCAFNGDSETPEPPHCQDGIDNDSDGFIDTGDPGCTGPNDTDEENPPVAACKDGIDNDSDGATDFPNDPGCTLSVDDDESDSCPSGDNCPACGNGVDDDDDGLVDYPEDSGCTNAGDGDEFNADPTICGASVPVSLLPGNGIAEGTFGGSQNNLISADCGGTGTEVAFQFTVTETQTLVVTTQFPETTTDTVIYVRSDCRMPGTELGCNDDEGSETTSLLVLEDVAPGDYFLIIDSNNEPGNYKVQVGDETTLPSATCTGETDAVELIDDPAMVGSNSGLTDDLTTSCSIPLLPSPDQVFELTVLGELETLDVDTGGSSFDTIVDIRFEDCVNAP
ncbi:MAG: hypothetical protein KJO07_05780, partial [Deltaproteobacteria bacterium]|nr:hypothetical protein [Deltaproteobacteria bacterium]